MKRKHFRQLLALTWHDRLLLLEASLWLGLARAAVLSFPFRWLVRGLRQQHGMTPETEDAAIQHRCQQIAWAIRVVSSRTPWDSNCLAQALAGKIMLRRRGIVSTLYLGVAKGERGTLDAHAWLRSGTFILTGGGNLSRYAVTATFADEHL